MACQDKGNSGLSVLLIISLVRLWRLLHVLSISNTMQGKQMNFEILIANNDRKCKAYEPLP